MVDDPADVLLPKFNIIFFFNNSTYKYCLLQTCRPLLVVTPFPMHRFEKNVFLFYIKKMQRGCVKHKKTQ